MASKPETTYIRRVHDQFKKLGYAPYWIKNHNAYSGGEADVWYSGDVGDLWVEYKFLPKLPKSGLIDPDCTPLQFAWLGARHEEGRKVWVVVGTPLGGVIFKDRMWERPLFIKNTHALLSPQSIATSIFSITGAACPLPETSFLPAKLRRLLTK